MCKTIQHFCCYYYYLYHTWIQVGHEKLINAQYCERFPVVRWKDGRVVHVQVTPEVHRNYEQRMQVALNKIQQRSVYAYHHSSGIKWWPCFFAKISCCLKPFFFVFGCCPHLINAIWMYHFFFTHVLHKSRWLTKLCICNASHSNSTG